MRVLVAGATGGIGRAVVAALCARGDGVLAVGRDQERLAALGALGGVVSHRADLAVAAEREAVVRAGRDRLGGLDAFVWAAGTVHYTPVEAVLDAELRAGLELNLVAPYLLARDAAAAMKAGGAIVLVASTLAFRPAPMTSVYAAAKGGLVALARSLALELAPAVRVNAIAPGVIDTDMVRVPRLRPGEPAPVGPARDSRVKAELDALRALHPAGRLGRPEDVAGGVLYLLDAAFVTGIVLTIDGGLSIR